MPIYDYHCQACEDDFCEQRPMSEYDQTSPCPKCQQEATRVVSGGGTFILKGFGWAADGYVDRTKGL